VRLEDRDEPVEFSHERVWTERGPARGQQLADLPEDPGDQCVVFQEVVDHRGNLGCSGAQRGQELAVLTGVMGVDRGAEAEAVAEQIFACGGVCATMAGAAGRFLAQ